MAIVTLTVGSNARQYTTLDAAWAAIPTDVVASGNSYVIELYKDSEFVFESEIVLSGKTTDATHTIDIRPAAGQGYLDNPNIATTPLRYNAANGVAFQTTWSAAGIQVNNNYVRVTGLQLFHNQPANNNKGGVMLYNPFGANVVGCVFDRCLCEVNEWGSAGENGFYVNGDTIVRNCTVISKGGQARLFGTDSSSTTFENCTGIRNNTSLGYGFSVRNGTTIRNSVIVGADFAFNGTPVGSNNAWTGVIGFGTNNKNNIVPADCFVDVASVATYDPRLKANSPLIDAGVTPSAANTSAINGNRQQGTSADIGAWEYPQVAQAPTATITTITVTGTSVTISGTTANSPTSGTGEVNPSNVSYNSGVAKAPAALTLGTNTFTITLTGLKVGRYDPKVLVSTTAYPNIQAVNNVGSFDIEGGKALSVVQDPMAGQTYSVHGTCVNATSGTLIIPAAATNPNGALQQNLTLTLDTVANPNTYTVSTTLAPGNYDAPILRFDNANGTSLPQAGTSAVSVVGFSGNPEGPIEPTGADTTAPVMSGSITTSNITSTGFTISWSAATDNVGVTGYEYSLNSGSTFLDNATALTKAVTGLSASTAYPVQVRAYDAAGNKSNVITTTITTAAPPADTTAPILSGPITVASITSTGFTMSWNTATDNVAVTGYEYSINGGTTYTSVGNVVTTAVTALAPDSTYQLAVRAYDAAGNKSTPVTATATTSSAAQVVTVPTAPRSVTAVAGITSATVSFLTPLSDGGASITGYVVTASTGQTATGADSPITIAMPAGVAVTFTVHANNSQGASPESAGSNLVTPLAAPDTAAPQMVGTLSVNSVTTDTAVIAWLDATDNTGVAKYGYSLNGSAYVDVLGTSATVTGLQPASVYTINVRAYDAAGNASAPISVQFTTANVSALPGTIDIVANHPRAVYVAVSGFAKKRSSGFTSYAKPRAIQDPNAALDYVFDWTEYLAATGSTIMTNEYFVSNAELGGSDFTDDKTIVFVRQGKVGKVGILTNRITTSDGRVDERSIQIKFKDQ